MVFIEDLSASPRFPDFGKTESSERFASGYESQQQALQRIPQEHRDIIEFMMETGVRPGEACALEVRDVDFRNMQAIIQRTWSGSKLRETTKGKSKRWIPLSDKAYEILERNVINSLKNTFVFINSVTKRGYRQEFIRRVWVKYSKSGVDLYSATRHTFCTQIVEMGASEIEAQGLMGHKDGRSTRRYFHPTNKRQREYVNNRGKVIAFNVKKGVSGNDT